MTTSRCSSGTATTGLRRILSVFTNFGTSCLITTNRWSKYWHSKCKKRFPRKTTIVIIRVSLRGRKVSNRFVNEGVSNFRFWAIGFAIALNWASSTNCGPSLSFTFTSLKSEIPASAFEVKYSISSDCGISKVNVPSGPPIGLIFALQGLCNFPDQTWFWYSCWSIVCRKGELSDIFYIQVLAVLFDIPSKWKNPKLMWSAIFHNLDSKLSLALVRAPFRFRRQSRLWWCYESEVLRDKMIVSSVSPLFRGRSEI